MLTFIFTELRLTLRKVIMTNLLKILKKVLNCQVMNLMLKCSTNQELYTFIIRNTDDA